MLCDTRGFKPHTRRKRGICATQSAGQVSGVSTRASPSETRPRLESLFPLSSQFFSLFLLVGGKLCRQRVAGGFGIWNGLGGEIEPGVGVNAIFGNALSFQVSAPPDCALPRADPVRPPAETIARLPRHRVARHGLRCTRGRGSTSPERCLARQPSGTTWLPQCRS